MVEVVKDYLLLDLSCEVEENKKDSFLFRRNLARTNDYLYFKRESRYLTFYIEADVEIVYKSSKIDMYTYGLGIISEINDILDFARFFSFHYSKI